MHLKLYNFQRTNTFGFRKHSRRAIAGGDGVLWCGLLTGWGYLVGNAVSGYRGAGEIGLNRMIIVPTYVQIAISV